jgi:predicted TIM-barrel fold metal-dependent hydrolase
MTAAIDIMNYAPLVAPGLSGPEYQYEEFRIMLRTTFKRMAEGGTIKTLWGREIPLDGRVDLDPTINVENALAQLDAAGYDVAVLACLKMWSYRHHHKLIIDQPEEVVAKAIAQAPDRLIGGAGFHPITFGIAPNDRRCYPLYAKCVELGIPVGFQVGHSAEVLPSDVGRPMLVDDVAIEFPDLKINMSHTGWPWTGEFCSMIWRHPNVYGDISAYFASTLDKELVAFMDSSRGRNKILYGTNGFDLVRFKTDFESLEISDKTRERVLHLNAIEFLGL